MKKLILLLGGVSLAAAITVRLFWQLEASLLDSVDWTSALRVLELRDLTSVAEFDMPVGQGRRFLISRPRPTQGEIEMGPGFDGRLTVELDGQTVYSVAIGSDSARKCDWLHRQGHLSEVLDMDAPGVLDKIPPGTRCRLLVDLDAEPKGEQAIWLSYVFRNRDLNKGAEN